MNLIETMYRFTPDECLREASGQFAMAECVGRDWVRVLHERGGWFALLRWAELTAGVKEPCWACTEPEACERLLVCAFEPTASSAAAPGVRLTPDEKESPDICDTHCTWMDHHPDCERASPSPPVDAQWVRKAMALASNLGAAWARDEMMENPRTFKVPAAEEALRTHLNTALSGETP